MSLLACLETALEASWETIIHIGGLRDRSILFELILLFCFNMLYWNVPTIGFGGRILSWRLTEYSSRYCWCLANLFLNSLGLTNRSVLLLEHSVDSSRVFVLDTGTMGDFSICEARLAEFDNLEALLIIDLLEDALGFFSRFCVFVTFTYKMMLVHSNLNFYYKV